MERRALLTLAAGWLAACSRNAPLAPPALPMVVAGWRREEWRNEAAAEAPAPVAALKVRGGFRTEWREGEQRIEMHAWAMGADASAFEAQQKWQHRTGVVTFHHGWWFITLEGTPAVAELIGFARHVETALPAGR